MGTGVEKERCGKDERTVAILSGCRSAQTHYAMVFNRITWAIVRLITSQTAIANQQLKNQEHQCELSQVNSLHPI